ncbi:hypothetical protein P7C70_g6014, partial [Phenoliferia sp. Uapishka_3]
MDNTLLTVYEFASEEKIEPSPQESVFIEVGERSGLKLGGGGTNTPPVVSTICGIMWSANIIVSLALSGMSFYCMTYYVFSLGDFLLVTFVMGAASNALAMFILVRPYFSHSATIYLLYSHALLFRLIQLAAEVQDYRNGRERRHQQSFGFWVSAFLDVVGTYLLVKFMKSEAWNDMIELVVQYAFASTGPQAAVTKRALVSAATFLIMLQGFDSITSATVEVVLEAVEDAEEAQSLEWSQLA